jgi:Mce-associated membrane protein
MPELDPDEPTSEDSSAEPAAEEPEGDQHQPAEPEQGQPDTDAKPTSRAAKLEAKAARLRERDEARARAAEARAAAGGTGAGGLPRSVGWMIAAIVLAVLLAALAGAGIPYLLHLKDQRDAAHRLDRARQIVIADANSYALDFGSYDYQHLDADYQKVASHLTSDFAKKYLSVSGALKATVVQYKGKSVAAVQGIAVSQISANSATVLVFLDQTVTTTQSSTARIDRNRLKLTMQRQRNGSWLISDLAGV